MLTNYTGYKFTITRLQRVLCKKLASTKVLTTSSMGFLLLAPLFYVIPVMAQSNQLDNHNIQVRFNTNEPDGSSQGRPGGRQGTGSRGDCPPVETALNALVPDNHSGSAIEENPTLWFYVPYQSPQVSIGEFSLQDEAKNDVMRTSFTPPSQPGIVGLDLKTTKPLEINKTYQWHFKLYCQSTSGGASKSVPTFVTGSIRRVAPKPDLEKLLKAGTTPRAKIAAYAQNCIWYTALTELASLRLAEPKNTILIQDWTNLLNDAGLKDLIGKPIIGKLKA
jgi:Domain of Unknown Function (DUF928)